jgi:hypothetical protein
MTRYDESVITMSGVEKFSVQKHADIGLVCEDSQVYAYFGSSLPRSESYVDGLPGTQRYTHGIITSKLQTVTMADGKRLQRPAPGWRLSRTEAITGKIIPEGFGGLDAHLLQNILVVAADAVDAAIEMTADQPVDPNVDVDGLSNDWPPSRISAERLYRQVRAHVIGGVGYTACGTYQENDGQLELTVIDETGGYSMGLRSMEGLVDDQQLAQMNQLATVLSI